MTPRGGYWVRRSLAGLGFLYGAMWAAQAVVTWQEVTALRASLGPLWADEGATLRGNPFEPPVILVRRPALRAEVGGQAMAWQAREARVQGWWFARRTVLLRDEALLTPTGSVVLNTWEWSSVPRAGVMRAGQVFAGAGHTVSVNGLAIAARPGGLRATADLVMPATAPAGLANVAVDADLPSLAPGAAWHDGGTAWLAAGAPAALRRIEATLGGARITGTGTLSWRGMSPTFEGFVTVADYGGALDRLASEGALTPAAAGAARAVLDLHAGAKPPAPLVVSLRDGVLVVGGFPMWRADPAE